MTKEPSAPPVIAQPLPPRRGALGRVGLGFGLAAVAAFAALLLLNPG